jgi:hypothetical protein
MPSGLHPHCSGDLFNCRDSKLTRRQSPFPSRVIHRAAHPSPDCSLVLHASLLAFSAPLIPPRLQDSQSHRDTRSLLRLHPSPHDIYPQKDQLALDSILASRLSMKVDRTARLSYRGSNLLPPRSSLTKVPHTTACVSVDLLTHELKIPQCWKQATDIHRSRSRLQYNIVLLSYIQTYNSFSCTSTLSPLVLPSTRCGLCRETDYPCTIQKGSTLIQHM